MTIHTQNKKQVCFNNENFFLIPRAVAELRKVILTSNHGLMHCYLLAFKNSYPLLIYMINT